MVYVTLVNEINVQNDAFISQCIFQLSEETIHVYVKARLFQYCLFPFEKLKLTLKKKDHQNVLQIDHDKLHLLSPVISNNFYPIHFFLQPFFFFRYFISST